MPEVIYAIVGWLSLLISLLCIAVEVWALVMALVFPADAYEAAGKKSKGFWAAVLGAIVAVNVIFALSPFGMLGLIALIVAGVFLADVKPAMQEVLRGSSRRGKGPVGLW